MTLSPFPNLIGHEFMNLTTFRKNGVGVITPVWFAEHNGKLYVTTQVSSGKAKRIRNGGHVMVGPCDRVGNPLGPDVEAFARQLPETAFADAAALLHAKYGEQYVAATSRNQATRIFIEIAPV
jgi:uncharacterized protein